MNMPRYFIVIAIVLLLWNLMGLAAFAMQYTADLTELAKSDPVTAQAFAAMPAWVWIAYTIAVGAGTLGAVLLLMKKAETWAMLMLSLMKNW